MKWWKKALIYSLIWLVVTSIAVFVIGSWYFPDCPSPEIDQQLSEKLGAISMGWFLFGIAIIWYRQYKKQF